MALCHDPLVRMLASLGYHTVRLPVADLRPLDVLGRESGKQLRNFGQVKDVLLGEPDFPEITKRPAPAIAGQKTARMRLSIGLDILGDLLTALGAVSIDLATAYESASRLSFRLTNVTRASVSMFATGSYLRSSDLDLTHPGAKYFRSSTRESFVVTSVLYSTEFEVIAQTRSGGAVEINAGTVQDIVGSDVGVSSRESDAHSLMYSGSEGMAFGFQAYYAGYAEYEENGDRTSGWDLVSTDPANPSIYLEDDGQIVTPSLLKPTGNLIEFN